MKFTAWLRVTKPNQEYVRLSKQIMSGSHDFPHHSSSNSLVKFCEKNNCSDIVKDALMKSWDDFIKIPNATIHKTSTGKKRT